MVDNAGIGEALAQGTNLRGDWGSPISHAVQFVQQNELKRAAREAEQAAKNAKKIDEASKWKSFSTGALHPALRKAAQKFGDDWINSMVLANGDVAQMSQLGQTGAMFKDDALSVNKRIEQDMATAMSPHAVINPKIREAYRSLTPEQYESTISKYDDVDRLLDNGSTGFEDHPVFGRLPKIISSSPNVDLKQDYDNLAKLLVAGADPKLVSQIDNYTRKFIYAPSREESDTKFDAYLSATPEAVNNIIYKNYDKSRKLMEQAYRNNPSIADNPELLADTRKQIAKEIASKDFHNDLVVKYSLKGVPTENKYTGKRGDDWVVNDVVIASPINKLDANTFQAISNLPSIKTASGNDLNVAGIIADVYNRPPNEKAEGKAGGFAFVANNGLNLGADGEITQGTKNFVFYNPLDKKAYVLTNYNESAGGFSGLATKAIPIDEKLYNQLKTTSKIKGESKGVTWDNIYDSYIPSIANPNKSNKSSAKIPKKGDIVNGYEFLGGDPKNPKSWRKK